MNEERPASSRFLEIGGPLKTVRLAPGEVFLRLIRPRWADRPLSGGGAARSGDRFNRPGVEVLYLARDVETALAEFAGTSPLPPPGILVAYRVRLENVIDFSQGYDAQRWAEIWRHYACDWKSLVAAGKTPPCWEIADALIAQGRDGLLFPSTSRQSGINLAVFMQNLSAPTALEVYDPDGDLPRDGSSWDSEEEEVA